MHYDLYYHHKGWERIDLANITQVSKKFHVLTNLFREYFYAGEDFDSLQDKKDIIGLRWLVKKYPERDYTTDEFDWAAKSGIQNHGNSRHLL